MELKYIIIIGYLVVMNIVSCPKKAITLLGKQVVEQCRYEKFVQSENHPGD